MQMVMKLVAISLLARLNFVRFSIDLPGRYTPREDDAGKRLSYLLEIFQSNPLPAVV